MASGHSASNLTKQIWQHSYQCEPSPSAQRALCRRQWNRALRCHCTYTTKRLLTFETFTGANVEARHEESESSMINYNICRPLRTADMVIYYGRPIKYVSTARPAGKKYYLPHSQKRGAREGSTSSRGRVAVEMIIYRPTIGWRVLYRGWLDLRRLGISNWHICRVSARRVKKQVPWSAPKSGYNPLPVFTPARNVTPSFPKSLCPTARHL